MTKKEIQIQVPSISIDEDFLISLSKIVNKTYHKNIPLVTEITLHSEREKSTFEKLSDLTSNEFWPREIHQLSIKKSPRNRKDKEKVVELYFNIKSSDKKDSYCQLSAYNSGILANCRDQIVNLFDRYKNWYNFIFSKEFNADEKPSNILELLNIGMSISFAILFNRLISLIPVTKIQEWSPVMAFIIFFIFYNYYSKFMNHLFTYFDFQIKKTKRSLFWNGILSTVTIGLLINGIIELVKWIVKIQK